MEKLPFSEEIKNGWYHRIFKSDLEEEHLKWHYDEEDRLMMTTHETDWMFQYDNQLPFKIELDVTYTIPKGQYHRLIKGTKDLEVKILKLVDKISKNLEYHLDNNLDISNSIFRLGSDAWRELINEVRYLYFEGKLELTEADKELIFTDAGKIGLYEGEIVPLDAPFPLNETEYAVFIKDDNRVKRVVFK